MDGILAATLPQPVFVVSRGHAELAGSLRELLADGGAPGVRILVDRRQHAVPRPAAVPPRVQPELLSDHLPPTLACQRLDAPGPRGEHRRRNGRGRAPVARLLWQLLRGVA